MGERGAGFGLFSQGGRRGKRTVNPDLLNVMRSQLAYNKATAGTSAQYEQYLGREEAGIKTAEQLADPTGAGAKRWNLGFGKLNVFDRGMRPMATRPARPGIPTMRGKKK